MKVTCGIVCDYNSTSLTARAGLFQLLLLRDIITHLTLYVLVFSPPPTLHPSLLSAVPKKLLQEQGLRPPAFSPPPSVHDPNIVGDSPPEGPSVKSHNSASGSWCTASPMSLNPCREPITINSHQTHLPCAARGEVIHVSSRVIRTCRHVYTHMVQPFPYVQLAEPTEFHTFLITDL